jgi:hypothetical protein
MNAAWKRGDVSPHVALYVTQLWSSLDQVAEHCLHANASPASRIRQGYPAGQDNLGAKKSPLA